MDTPHSKTNSYIFDLTSTAELARLIDQDRFLTLAMGGPLAGLPELKQEACVLDVACGPGGWVLDVAFARPDIEVCGIDLSQGMIDYANARARTQERSNASFGVMNVTQPLDFSDATFDLINARLLVGVFKRENWDQFLDECTRLLRPGGILRLTEPNDGGATNSETFEYFNALSMKGLWHAGYGFSLDGRSFGMSPVLLAKMKSRGYQTHISSFIGDYSYDSPGWPDFFHNSQVTTPQLKPLLLKEGNLTDQEFDLRYQRLLAEMQAVDFSAVWHFTTLWGTAHLPL